MIVLTESIYFYGKKIITDLVSRQDIFSNKDSFCQLYGGLRGAVYKYWGKYETDASLELLTTDQADFDADKSQPPKDDGNVVYSGEDDEDDVGDYEKCASYDPNVDTLDSSPYFRRLEEIKVKYIKKYVENLVFSIKKFNNGVKTFESRHQLQPCLINSANDDPDEFTEFADLQLTRGIDDWPADVRHDAVTRMPYVLKRLHNLSRYMGVHMVSYAASFLVAKDLNERMRIAGSQSYFKKNDVIRQGVYLCDGEGNITKRVETQNKNKRAEFAFQWAMGQVDEYAEYYSDLLDFAHYCNVLNIELEYDDMTKYQADFMDKLIVTTVTPNRQYDATIYKALLNNSTNPKEQQEFDIDSIEETINCFNQAIYTDETLSKVVAMHNSESKRANLENAKALHSVYSVMYLKTCPDMKKYKWDGGFLYYDGALAIIDPNILSDPNSRSVFVDNRCIMSELGYCIVVSSSGSSTIMTLDLALMNLKDRVSAHDPDYSYGKWWVVGI